MQDQTHQTDLAARGPADFSGAGMLALTRELSAFRHRRPAQDGLDLPWRACARPLGEHTCIVESRAEAENHMMFSWQLMNADAWLTLAGSGRAAP
jgi:hypothetical protein